MHVDAPRLSMMDLTTNHSGIGVRLHLKAGNTVSMDVTALKVTLGMENRITPTLIKIFWKNKKLV